MSDVWATAAFQLLRGRLRSRRESRFRGDGRDERFHGGSDSIFRGGRRMLSLVMSPGGWPGVEWCTRLERLEGEVDRGVYLL